jgi:transposase-like protein
MIRIGNLCITNPEALKAVMRESLHSFAVELGVEVAVCLLRDEVRQLCGERSERVLERTAYRHGTQPGYVVMAGQKVALLKPRVRGTSGGEIDLNTYVAMQAEDAMPQTALAKMVRGVSCRDYAGVVDEARAGFGIKKSSVSRYFVRATQQQLDEFLRRRLDTHTFAAILIDGVDFAGAAMVCALGIADDGTKRVLGVRQGDTENAEVVKSLLADVRDRGIPTDQPLLFVLDGSKALRAGVQRVWGANAVIQRCQIHKKRNVKAHLAKKHHAELDRRLNQAYSGNDYERSLKQLHETMAWLQKLNPDAANSLREGLEETLTVIRLGLTGDLRRLLSSTNTIESTFSRVRDVTRRVKHWQDGSMRQRWCVAGLIRAEAGFRKVKGYRQLPKLIEAVKILTLDNQEQAA